MGSEMCIRDSHSQGLASPQRWKSLDLRSIVDRGGDPMPQRDVQVTSTKTGKVVGIYTVVLEGLNYEPADHEYFDQAITAAIEDGAMRKDEVNDVNCQFG